ncbi:hypothetical protein RQP46_005800 [Phenoliferia psychrophenolica]
MWRKPTLVDQTRVDVSLSPPLRCPATLTSLITADGASDSDDDGLSFFSDSLLSIFDHVQPIHGEPSQLHTYTPPPSAPNQLPLVVRIPPQEKTLLYAHYVWNAGIKLADRIALGEVDVKGKIVLEMGAGTGIPAFMSAREGAAKVVVSDYDDPSLVLNLQRNIPLALPSPLHQSLTHAVGFTWGSSPAPLLSLSPPGYSLILLADTLWFSEGHDALLSSLVALLSHDDPTARIEIVAGFHSGRETVRAFLRKAEENDLVMEGEWDEVMFDGKRRKWGWDVEEGLLDEEPIAERNRSVVEAYLIKTYDHSRKFQGATLTSHDPFIRDEILTSFCSASLHPFMLLKVFISSGFLTDNTHGQLIEPRIAGALAYLEDQLGEQEYFMGKEPGRPDFMISLPIDGIVQRGGEGLLGPRMKAWRERVLEREGWKKALEKPGVPYDLTFGKK